MNDDLRAVRTFMDERPVAPPSPGLRPRVLAATRPRRRTARWLVPATAAVAALAVLGGIGLALRHDGGGPPASSATSSPASPPPAVSIPPYTGPLPIAGLLRAAAQTEAVAAPDGSYLYRRTDLGAHNNEVWFEAKGLIQVKIREDGRNFESRPSTAEIAESQRLAFARTGAGYEYPTPAWLASLPADPDRLLAELRRTGALRQIEDDFAQCVSLFVRADPLLPPAARSGMLLAMARTPGLTTSNFAVDGRALIGLRHGNIEVYFDPATAHAVGSDTVAAAGATKAPSGGAGQSERQFWTFQVVPKLPA